MKRLGAVFISILVVVAVASAAAISTWHIRSLNEVRDVALSLKRLTSPGYAGIFKANAGPPKTNHATDYIVEILKSDNTVETRTLSLPGVDSGINDMFSASAMKIYAQRVRGGISIAVDPETYVLRKGEKQYDMVWLYGAVIDPAKLPKNYIGTLRDHAVAWDVQGKGSYHNAERHAQYFRGLTGCSQTPYSPPEDNVAGEHKLLIHEGQREVWGELPQFAVGDKTFYSTEPDRRACEHGGDGDPWNPCEDILAFNGGPHVTSGRCPAMGIKLLDSCAVVGEVLLCNLEGIVAIRFRRKVPLTDYIDPPVYLISAPYLDGGVVLPPRGDAAYEKAVEKLTPDRIRRALAVQGRLTPVPLGKE